MPGLDSILRPWINQPAGLFSNSHHALVSFPSYFTEDMDPAERKAAIQGFHTIAVWICSAKKLTKRVRDLFINGTSAWGEGVFTREQVIAFIDVAHKMGPTDAQLWLDKLGDLPTLAGHLKKPLLYYAMSVAGCDGLQPEELERLLWVSTKFNVSEDDMGELIGMFYHERNLIREMNKHFGQSKL